MKNTIETWVGSDADLLVELNRPQFKRVIGDGMVTLAMIGTLGPEVSANLSLTLDMILAGLPSETFEERATKSQFEKFSMRLCVSDRGLDFANDVVRAQITQALTGAGWSQPSIDAVLGLGAVYESAAQQYLGREATQLDVDAIRVEIAKEALESEFRSLMNDGNPAGVNVSLANGNRAGLVAALRNIATSLEN